MNTEIKNITIKDILLVAITIIAGVVFFLWQGEQDEKRELRNILNHITIHNAEDLQVNEKGIVARVEK